MPAVAPGTGSTPFEDMSHERMLAWLDRANRARRGSPPTV